MQETYFLQYYTIFPQGKQENFIIINWASTRARSILV